ncbi:hypothetical protein UPYG_G00351110 [Umbra pygmaea]|uniref:TERF1-interacting nuclear factor 2 N-terminal domain-containing protein n=1 Tax=Umbra pygmaea TaxID=75934 RepID=A0ABD0VZD2_UMBPY
MNYCLVEEFVTSVLDIVPDMMTYRERIQLIMGLRAQLVLELCRPDHLVPPDSIQPHLNRMKACVMTDGDDKICDPEVEASGSNFLKLIETLQEDPVEKDHFFQKVFPEEFGPKYHSALQTLMWEFLSRLEKLLPTPTLQQTVSWFLPERCVLEECLQAVSQPQPLRFLLQNHTNKSAASHTKNKASGDQHILSSMSCSSPETQDALTDQADLESEQTQGLISIQSPASADIVSESSPPFDYWENEQKDCVEVMLLNKRKGLVLEM